MITLKSDDSLAVRIARLEERARAYRAMGIWEEALKVEREALALQRQLRDAMKPMSKRAVAPLSETEHGRLTTYQRGCRCPGCRGAVRDYHRWYRSLERGW